MMTRPKGKAARPLSRRRLIASGAAAAVLAASSLGVRANPQRGGVLRVAVPGRPDPRVAGLSGRMIAPGSVYDCLTEVAADGQLRGELADAWEPQDQGRTWVISLVDGAEFHNGRPFLADDAIASLRTAVGLPSGIVRFKKHGDRRFQVWLDAPDPAFPFLLSDPTFIMRPARDSAEALRQGIGTGPYRCVEPPGTDRLRLARIPSHRTEGDAGWFDRIELLGLPSPADRSHALLDGRVDVASAVCPRFGMGGSRVQLRALATGAHLRLETAGSNARAIADALKAGLDRAAILDQVLGGQGHLAADHPLDAGRIPDVDLGRARAILHRAGVDRIGVAAGPGIEDFSALPDLMRGLGQFAQDTGIALSVATGTPDISISLARGMPTVDLALRAFPTKGLEDPKGFADQLARARLIPNSFHRNEVYANLAQILAAESLIPVPVFAHQTFAHTSRLTHLGHIGALDTLDSARMAKRWYYRSSGQLPS